MANDIGRCVNCGFLCKRRTIVDADSIVYRATIFDREQGTFHRQSGWPEPRDTPTWPACFRNAAFLQQEFITELSMDGTGTGLENHCVCEVIGKDRKCELWYPWTEYLSPKEHFEEFKMRQLEQDRREFEFKLEEINRKERNRTNCIMIFLAIAALIFAALQVYATLASINPEHWLFDWLR